MYSSRYIVNRLMGELGTPVLFIDVDPGQAEFSLPGNNLIFQH